jgi:hypothetical protein
MKVRLYGAAVAFALLTIPDASHAQDDDAQPEFRYVTTSSFRVPFGDERQRAMVWIDSVMVPTARLIPNVLAFRVATHNWGSNSNDIVLMTEYPSFEAINADCEPCAEWFETRQPAEGTPERETWDGWLADFLTAYSGHRDEIYVVNMNRAK